MAISRRREFLADANSALLTRYPAGLASALKKIAGDTNRLSVANKATESLYIYNPLKDYRGGVNSLFNHTLPSKNASNDLRRCDMAALIYPAIEPVAFRLGPLAIRWYGLAYVAGFVVAAYILRRLNRRWDVGLTSEQQLDIVLAAVIGIIVGGRLGYVLFYGGTEYLREPPANPCHVGRRDVVPWRSRRDPSRRLVHLTSAAHPVSSTVRSGRRGRSGRFVPRSTHELRDRRVVGTRNERAVGYGVPKRWARMRDTPRSSTRRSSRGRAADRDARAFAAEACGCYMLGMLLTFVRGIPHCGRVPA